MWRSSAVLLVVLALAASSIAWLGIAATVGGQQERRGATERRQAQGSPPAPVAPAPAPAPIAVPAPAPAAPAARAKGCFSAIPGHHMLHAAPAVAVGGVCRPFVAVVAPCTSRGKKYRGVAETPYVEKFFQTVLMTLLKSEDVGYDVAFCEESSHKLFRTSLRDCLCLQTSGTTLAIRSGTQTRRGRRWRACCRRR